jgi:hypothetical protein
MVANVCSSQSTMKETSLAKRLHPSTSSLQDSLGALVESRSPKSA